LRYGNVTSDNFTGPGITSGDTRSADRAFVARRHHPFRRLRDSLVRTGPHAIAAVDASVGTEDHLLFSTHPLRVMTPPAVEGTALEKDRCADSGAIIKRKPHDIEDAADGTRIFPFIRSSGIL